MAFQEVSSPVSYSEGKGIFGKIGAALGGFMYALMTASAAGKRVELVERLQAKSDEELAAMNIRREDIVHLVFRDLFHV